MAPFTFVEGILYLKDGLYIVASPNWKIIE